MDVEKILTFAHMLLFESAQYVRVLHQQSLAPEHLHGAEGALYGSLQLGRKLLLDLCLDPSKNKWAKEVVGLVEQVLVNFDLALMEGEGSIEGIRNIKNVRVKEVKQGVGLVKIILDWCAYIHTSIYIIHMY